MAFLMAFPWSWGSVPDVLPTRSSRVWNDVHGEEYPILAGWTHTPAMLGSRKTGAHVQKTQQSSGSKLASASLSQEAKRRTVNSDASLGRDGFVSLLTFVGFLDCPRMNSSTAPKT
jgi:hypothetical protein